MISELELEQIRSHADALVAATDSDDVRLGRAIHALVEAHDALKQPHVQALANPTPPVAIDADAKEAVLVIADNLDAALVMARSTMIPLETHVAGLKSVVTQSRDGIWAALGKPY